MDNSGVLADLNSDVGFTSKGSPYRKNFSGRKSDKERKNDRKTALDKAFEACEDGGKAVISELADYLGKSEKTIRRNLKETGEYWVEGGEAGKK